MGTAGKTASAVTVMILLFFLTNAGGEWQNITAADEEGLPSNEIQFIKQDREGAVWIGTLGGLTRYEDGRFEKIIDGRIWDILYAGDNAWHIGTNNGIVFFRDGETIRRHTGNSATSLATFGEREIWAVSLSADGHRVVRLAGGEWDIVPGFEGKDVVDIYKTSDGHIWVLIEGNGMYRIDPETYEEKTTGDHLLRGMYLTTLFEDSRGRIWTGSWGRGVRVLENDRWRSHLGGGDTFILGIAEDDSGGIWVATNDRGAWHYDGTRWENRLEGGHSVNVLYVTSDGRVWISSSAQNGLSYWDGEKWVISLNSLLPVRCLTELDDGRLWAGGVVDGLHIKDERQ